MSAAFSAGIGTGLTFTKMTDLGLAHGFDLQYSVVDKTRTLYLCVGEEDNRVLVTGTTPASRQAAVLNAIDQFDSWGQDIELWMVAEKNGSSASRTQPIKYRTHVKPYYGNLTISQIAAAQPRMTYPGNGRGRLLSKRINDRYYSTYSGKLETDDPMRGFDCTTFPMALLAIPRIAAPGYGKHLCDAAGGVKCDLEQVDSAYLAEQFKNDTIPVGLYLLFSADHVLLYEEI